MRASWEVFQELVRCCTGEASKQGECTKRKQIAAAVLPQLAAVSTKHGCWLHWGMFGSSAPSSAPPCLFGSVLCSRCYPSSVPILLHKPSYSALSQLVTSSHNLPFNAARWSVLAHTPRRHLQLPALGSRAHLTCQWSDL